MKNDTNDTKIIIGTKKIKDLDGKNFFIPAYQRGYRWSETEVRSLLDDIFEAKETSEQKDGGYCIQPLIVKPRSDGTYEVVDGQQRLTTIFILMNLLTQYSPLMKSEFSLRYETRNDCVDFFSLLKNDAESCKKRNKQKEENIDYYHIAKAYDAMNEWFLEHGSDMTTVIFKLYPYVRDDVFFVWYEIPEESDSVEVFTKVNLGKIRLTNAELIKALFLNKDNFEEKKETNRQSNNNDSDEETLGAYKNGLEIALEWDAIERGLNEDAFWYFLQDDKPEGPRMDLLLNLLAREKDPLDGKNSHKHDYAFSVFYDVLKKSEDRGECVNRLWHEVSQMYSDFRYWYSNEDLYHIIGYLIYAGVPLREIREITRNKTKNNVVMDLIDRAKRTLPNYAFKQGELDLSQVNYRRPKENLRQILLLFNVATLFCEELKEYRFPFDRFKSKEIKWDIEHIHATADDSAGQDDELWNLTLLADRINRGYKDAPFSVKRKDIIDFQAKGWFIPVCTKNVFMKAYTDPRKIQEVDLSDDWKNGDSKKKEEHMENLQNHLKKMQLWNDEDKKAYLEKMEYIFKKFFAGERVEDTSAANGGGSK